MPDMEKVTIEATRLGLAANASAAEIRDKVYALQAENADLRADRDKWQGRAEENQRELVAARGSAERVKELEGDLLIAKAREADKIDEEEIEHYREMYKLSPELCKKRLDALRERKYLRTQESLKGPFSDPPNDPMLELAAKVAEKIANDKNGTLSEAEARKQVLMADANLYERVRQAEYSKTAKGTDGRAG